MILFFVLSASMHKMTAWGQEAYVGLNPIVIFALVICVPLLTVLAICFACSCATRLKCSCFVIAILAGIALISSMAIQSSRMTAIMAFSAYAGAIVSIGLSKRLERPRAKETHSTLDYSSEKDAVTYSAETVGDLLQSDGQHTRSRSRSSQTVS